MRRASLFLLFTLAASAAGAEPFAASPVADAALGMIAGRAADTQSVLANNSATVANNAINGQSITGVININGNAFQNLTGLAIINSNTGNNVAINASLNVNVSIHP